MELIKKENHFQMLSKSVKEVDTETWKGLVIEWYASTKDKDRYWDIVEPSAFEKAMNVYALNPILLLQHDADKPIGKVDAFTIDWNGLYIRAIVSEDTDWVMSKIKNWILKWFSIWFRILDYEIEYKEDDEWNIIDRTNYIKELELLEISLVSIPANPYALRKSINDCFSSKSVEMPEEKIKTPVEETEEVVEEEKKDEEVVENEEEINSEDDTTTEEKAVEETEITPNENEEAEKTDEKPATDENETNLTEEKSFEVVRKEFSEQLEKKDVEIKAYAKKVDDLDSKLSETIKVLSSVVNAVKSIHDTVEKTVVQNSYQFQWPIVKDEAKDEIEKAVQFMKKQ